MAGFDPVSMIATVANTVLQRVIPDKPAQQAAQVALAQMQLSGDLAAVASQAEIDKAEAASGSVFVAGWRPFIGWICGAGLGYQFLLRPLLTFCVSCSGHAFTAPELDMGTLTQLLIGMLGLGAMRTVEKVNNINSGH